MSFNSASFSYYHRARLLQRPDAARRAVTAFDRLLATALPTR